MLNTRAKCSHQVAQQQHSWVLFSSTVLSEMISLMSTLHSVLAIYGCRSRSGRWHYVLSIVAQQAICCKPYTSS